jgi:hypothetical protein
MKAMDDNKGRAALAAQPEYCDARGGRVLFGLSPAHLYDLAAKGSIRSVCLRRPGAARGRRLFDCASIRTFLEAHVEGGER